MIYIIFIFIFYTFVVLKRIELIFLAYQTNTLTN